VNILALDQFPEIGGAQRCLIDLLPAFKNCEWNVSIAAPGEGGFLRVVRELGFETDILDCHTYQSARKPPNEFIKYGHDLVRTVVAIHRITRIRCVDLIYVNGPRLLLPAAIVARLSSIPLLFHCHNRVLQPAALFVIRRALHLGNAKVIACCEFVVQPFAARFLNGQATVIYNGVGAELPARRDTPLKRRRIGVIGRIEKEKGQLEFVLAARLILQHYPDCKFLVVGAPVFSSAEYLNTVTKASHGLPIEFLGWRSDVPELLSKLDLLIVPSSAIDATTRVIIEAFAAGVPVVAFPSGGIPEILIDEKTGFLAASHTAEALADRIMSVLRMPRERVHSVVEHARKQWRERYSLEVYRQRVLEVFADLAGRNMSQRMPCKSVGGNVHR